MHEIPTKIWIGLLVVAVLFLAIGCSEMLRDMGWTEAEVQAKQDADKQVVMDLIDQSRTLFWESATVGIGILGTVITGLLGKWVRDERKLTAVMIRGVEKNGKEGVKASIATEANAAGVESKLHARVQKLT